MHYNIDMTPYLQVIADILIEFTAALSDPQLNKADQLLKNTATLCKLIDSEVARLNSEERG